MNIVLITQDEPFYLAENINNLINDLPNHSRIVGCILLNPSPFGKKESLLKKASKTYSIFGMKFFLRYAFEYFLSKINKKKSVAHVLDFHNIPILYLNSSINSKQSLQRISGLNPDLLISVAGNEIFKKPLIDLAPKGCLNLHTALLPKYRGLMPSFWVLKNNESKTGVSVFFVDEGIDSGPILVQKELKIGSHNQRSLIIESKALGMKAIIEAIEKIHNGDLTCIPNLEEEMSYYRFPTASDVKEFLSNGGKFF
jgi:methionyl-tRNA formyltransferase